MEAAAATNRSVDRACRLISAFTLHEPVLSLSELARRVDLPKATVHRIAAALLARGMLAQGLDGRYALGAKLLELGAVVRESLDAVQLCRPAIETLAAETGETVLLATADWQEREMLIVERRNSPHPLAVGSPVGQRMSIPPGGALGKALLAGLAPEAAAAVVGQLSLVASTSRTIVDPSALLRDISKARGRGYAVEQGEYFEGVSAVAVPVIFEGAQPLASLGVVGPTSRLSGEIGRLGGLLRDVTDILRPRVLPGDGQPAARA